MPWQEFSRKGRIKRKRELSGIFTQYGKKFFGLAIWAVCGALFDVALEGSQAYL
ncbi:MAG: hypothetical protein WCS30_10710 [Selenomonadaceae bacterium]